MQTHTNSLKIWGVYVAWLVVVCAATYWSYNRL